MQHFCIKLLLIIRIRISQLVSQSVIFSKRPVSNTSMLLAEHLLLFLFFIVERAISQIEQLSPHSCSSQPSFTHPPPPYFSLAAPPPKLIQPPPASQPPPPKDRLPDDIRNINCLQIIEVELGQTESIWYKKGEE